MTYEEALNFIYSRRKFAKSSGFERISALLQKLDNPQNDLKFIHVAGTNGKGSVSTAVSSILTAAGLKTGLFTSPFVTTFRERIQTDAKYIDKESFCKITKRISDACEDLSKNGICPTFFETVLAAALVYFKESGCDIAVLEAGIGGKDDSTNIIPPPLAAVITSVSFDHVDVLGNTLFEISSAKCGIIKDGSFVISFPDENAGLDFVPQQKESLNVIENTCKQKDCSLFVPDMSAVSDINRTLSKTEFIYDSLPLSINFSGDHQIANAAVSYEVIKALRKKGFNITDEQIKTGFKNAFIPARMEVFEGNPTTVLDGGHNVGCVKALCAFLNQNFKGKKITAVLSFMKDKDYETAIKLISPLCENIVFTLADEKRGQSPKVLSKCAKGLCKNIFSDENILSAFEKAKSISPPDSIIVCAGSFYSVSEIRKFLTADGIRQK